MALSLKDRVRAVAAPTAEQPTVEATVTRTADVPQQSTPDELHSSAQGESGDVADIALDWLERYGEEFTKALPSHIDNGVFLAAVRAALPGLVRCTPASLLQALLTCARFGLVPDGRHAVIKREGKTAVFVPMAQGYVELMYRSGRVGSVHVGMIHEADEWSYEPSAPAPLDFTHKPRVELSKKDRGPAILAYAFCWMTSGARSQVIVLSREDAEAIRDEYSSAYQRAKDSGANDSFWHTDFDKMWAKSALRRLHKVVPMSAELVALLAADDAGDEGRVQVVHAPDPEVAVLAAEAERAYEAAEGSQELADAALPRKSPRTRRTQPTRSSRKSRGARSRKGARR
ncbi:recombinase RecT [Streptomyces sp. SM8]|uniref:recombinase RecT n=1 Tax=Streptomyces sp. SM8 TaxID=1195457 RepID=UPI0002830BE2|nr:recombinase RecT [Streptomyces sp. SM8]PKA32878.1 recombinase RecT [Streptomyces sp. SM8]